MPNLLARSEDLLASRATIAVVMTALATSAMADDEIYQRERESVCLGIWSGVLREDIGVNRFENHDNFLTRIEVLNDRRLAELENGVISNEEGLRLEQLNSEAFRQTRTAVLALDDPERSAEVRVVLDQALAGCAELADSLTSEK